MKQFNGTSSIQKAGKVRWETKPEDRLGEGAARCRQTTGDEAVQTRLYSMAPALELKTQEQPAQLDKPSDALATAIQTERQTLARLLHDDLAQSLFIARLQLSLVVMKTTDALTIAALREVNESLMRSTIAMRDLMMKLSTPPIGEPGVAVVSIRVSQLLEDRCHVKLKTHGLCTGLMSMSQQFLRLHGLTVTMDGACVFEPREVPAAEIFASVRELLMNIVKYSGVTRANIHLEGDERGMRIQISDDGAGFDARTLTLRPTTEGGFGLRSVLERVAAIGGRMEVASAVGHGTKVTLIIPAAAAHGDATLHHPLKGN